MLTRCSMKCLNEIVFVLLSGYVEPEYKNTSILKKESDVYSFGIIRLEKVRRIFQLFDRNEDGGLNKEELEALLVAINFDLKHCSQETISSSTDKVFCLYDKFIDGEKGLTCYGLLRIYDDGDGDLDLDYEKLGLNVKPHSDGGPIFSFRAPGRCEKAWRIFEHFDLNNDGGLNREELEALIVATNYNVRYDHFLNQYEKKYIDGEMGLNVDDFFNRYEKYIDGKKGLTFYGLLLSYDQGDLDLDQISDFLAMMFKLYTKINDQVALGRRIR
ncbi:hypothetical protein L1987_34849 [Smallanthus sonchifolius]|uniref:Uncharacterized protein n=1 Tax=Smallanthus sonchifolius TaxID=185202 RepID=A0ACB9HWP1_9ASTR|nr:hypothetical protein L1987_34849 [Smallanthus sonchifolius]